MAYRIEIELIEQNKFIHAMHIFNKILALVSKFGAANFSSIKLIENDRWEPLANVHFNPKVVEKLEAEHKEVTNNVFKTIMNGPNEAQ